MPRYRLLLEYDGAAFVGWQRQAEGLSVQQAIEEAAAHLNDGAAVACAAAGRTDAGVHAAGQVAQIDLARDHPPGRVRDALNFYTRPLPLAVLDCRVAPEGWHARFSATARAYDYVILNRRAPAALDLGRVWHIPVPLDAAAMHAAAQTLVGRHDFSSFRAAACQAKSALRTLDTLAVTRNGDRIRVFVRARSFLHHQVRNMVGTLAQVGRRKLSAPDVAAILAARDRRRAGETAPPQGLTLLFVRYDQASHAPADETIGDGPGRCRP
jgi:tRNA pseudouridine38-40 synthase